jgi:proteasome maturation protein
MENLRRVYGIAEPIRRGMEMKIVRDGTWRPAALGGGGAMGNIHEEILALGGRETEITWEDVFHSKFSHMRFVLDILYLEKGLSLTGLLLPTGEELREPPSFHDEMEQRLKMNW